MACQRASATPTGRNETRTSVQWPRIGTRTQWFRQIGGWRLAGSVDDAGFDRLVSEANQELAGIATSDGAVIFQAEALVAAAQC